MVRTGGINHKFLSLGNQILFVHKYENQLFSGWKPKKDLGEPEIFLGLETNLDLSNEILGWRIHR